MFKWLAKVTVELLAELTPKSPAPGCPSEMQGQVIWVAPLRDYQKLSAPEVKVKVIPEEGMATHSSILA